MKLLPWLFVLSLGAVVSACGGRATTSNDENGDGDVGDGDAGDGDGDGDTGDGDGDASVCAGFSDDLPGHLEILIRNERFETIYLGPRDATCGTPPIFSVSNANGEELHAHAEMCSVSCEQLLEGGGVGCPGICLYPEVVRIDPGEGYSIAWDTRVFVERYPSLDCPDSPVASGACLQGQRIEPGLFLFKAVAGTETTCDPELDPECFERIVAGASLSAETAVRLDASYGIYDKPESDDGANPAPAPGPGANLGIEIVFHESSEDIDRDL